MTLNQQNGFYLWSDPQVCVLNNFCNVCIFSPNRVACPSASKRLLIRPLSLSSYRKSAEPIAAPTADGETKEYSENITTIVDKISKLTLVEVADLNELLKVEILLVNIVNMYCYSIDYFRKHSKLMILNWLLMLPQL